MKLALDTNRYSDLASGIAEAADAVESAAQVCLPVIVLGELRTGFLRGTRARQNEAVLGRFLRTYNVTVLNCDAETSRHYAALAADLRSRGTPIPDNDCWIAALSLQHGCTLYARDAHFDLIPQLDRL